MHDGKVNVPALSKQPLNQGAAVQMLQNLEGLGFTMVQFGQGYKDMSPSYTFRASQQLGLSMTELDLLTIGLINDMFTERENDEYSGWNELASQSDMDMF